MGEKLTLYRSSIPAQAMRRFAEERLMMPFASGSGPTSVFDETDRIGGRSDFFRMVRRYELMMKQRAEITTFTMRRAPSSYSFVDNGPEATTLFRDEDALYRIARDGRPLHAQALEKIVRNAEEHPYQRLAALEGLGRIRDPRSIPLIGRVAALPLENIVLRRAAERILGAWVREGFYGRQAAKRALDKGETSLAVRTQSLPDDAAIYRPATPLESRLAILEAYADDPNWLLDAAAIFLAVPADLQGDEEERRDLLLLQHAFIDQLGGLRTTDHAARAYDLIKRGMSFGWRCLEKETLTVPTHWSVSKGAPVMEERSFCLDFQRTAPLTHFARLFEAGLHIVRFRGGTKERLFRSFVAYGDFGHPWFPSGAQADDDLRDRFLEAHRRFLGLSAEVREMASE